MRSVSLITFALVLTLPLAVGAQSLDSLGSVGSAASFTVSAAPQYPAPYGKSTLTFLSSSLTLANAMLTVSVDGKEIYRGTVRPVAVALGAAGSVANVSATISSAGASYTQSLVIQPQDVVLVAEPVSSAPPLYRGKPLVPLEGSVRVVAAANLRSGSGAALNPSTLSYSWTVDGVSIANSSGIGKSAIMVASPLQYRVRDVSVSVMSADGSLVGGASLSLSAADPLVRIYENDPLLGIRFDRALSGTYAIASSESTLYAAPFSLPTTGGAPLIRWFLNGDAAQAGGSITLRPTGSGRGNASLSLTASAGQYTTATAALSLIFGERASANFFGL